MRCPPAVNFSPAPGMCEWATCSVAQLMSLPPAPSPLAFYATRRTYHDASLLVNANLVLHTPHVLRPGFVGIRGLWYALPTTACTIISAGLRPLCPASAPCCHHCNTTAANVASCSSSSPITRVGSTLSRRDREKGEARHEQSLRALEFSKEVSPCCESVEVMA